MIKKQFLISSIFIILEILNTILADEFIVEQSLNNDASFSTTGYSSSSTVDCTGTSISEASHLFLGTISGGQSVSKTWTGLPPHFQASVRVDYLLLDNWDSDLFNIYFDGNMITQQLNRSGENPYNLCLGSSKDRFYRGYWSRVHSTTSLTLKIELQSVSTNTNKYIGFRAIQIILDTCHQSCKTCKGNKYNNCDTCPIGIPDGDDRCYCPAGQYAQNYSCVSSCTGGTAPNPTTGFCEKVCTGSQFYFNGACITPDPAVKNKQYQLAYGLFSNNFSAVQIYNMGWKIMNMGQVGVFSDCGSYRIFGGYAIMTKETKMQIKFYSLPKHYNVKIKLVAVLIDWSSSNTATIKLDGTDIETINRPGSGGSQICGLTTDNDYVYTLNKPAYAHSDAQMQIDITTNYLVDDVFSFGFGIREIEIYLDSCPDNCQQCGATGCVNCFPGFLLYNNSCVSPCPAKTYPITNIAKPKCDDCYSNCATCSIGNASNECDTCPTGMYLKEGSCVTDCGDNYYTDTNNVCQPCDKTCLRCTSQASNSCTKCQSPLYLNKIDKRCVEKPNCPDGTYPEVSDRTCAPCHATCLTCNGPTDTDCLSCSNYLDVNSCKSDCGIGKFANDLKKTCEKCDVNCYTCSKQATNCTSCSDPNFLENTKCQPNCPTSKYGDTSDRTCKTCPMNCTSCIGGTASECTGCANGYFLTLLDLVKNSGTCGLSCASGYWTDTQFNYCKPCYTNCATCDPPGNQNSCKTCKTNYYLTIERSCDKECPDRYYKDTIHNVCLPCHNTCLKCSQSGDKFCTKCDTGRYLLLQTATEGSCWINCPDTKYNEGVTSTCQDCFGGCRTCSGKLSNQCAACMPGKYFYKNECIDSCPDGTYPNIQALKCEDCHLTCKTCNGPLDGNCISCGGTRYLKGSSCISNCPDGQYNDLATNICKPCDATCNTCYGPGLNECESCKNDRFLNTNSHNCDQICPSGQYAQKQPQQICKLCNAVCNTCSGPSEKDCSGCPDNRFLWNKQCLSNCPIGYFRENTPNRCTTCHETCARCDNSPLANKCTSCNSSRYFLNSECLLQCPDGYYGDKILNQCGKCYKSCKTCFDIEYNNCLSCFPGTYLIKNTCVPTCPDHYVPDNATGTCVECPKECSACLVNNPTLCTKCQTGWYLLDQKCLQRCPDAYYTDYNKQTCEKCMENCDECTGPNMVDCLKWHVQDIPWTQLIIFWLFIGKSAYCAFAFLLGYYLDTKCKPLGERKPFKDPREVVKYKSIAPAPQTGASGKEVINRRGRNGTIIDPNNDQNSIYPQSLAGIEDQENSPKKMQSKNIHSEEEENQSPTNNQNNRKKNKGKGKNKSENPNNPQSDDEDNSKDGSDDNQNTDKNNENDENDDDDDDNQVQQRNDGTEKMNNSNANPEQGGQPKPEKKGIKFLRKAILRHGTLMKLRGDIRKKTDKEILDLIIPKGEEAESKKKKIGVDEMVVESIDAVPVDNPEDKTPQLFQRNKTKQGTVAFDNTTTSKKDKLKLTKMKTKTNPNLALNDQDDENDEDDYGNPNNQSTNGKRKPKANENDQSQSTIFNPNGTTSNFPNKSSINRPITPATTINLGNKTFMSNNPTLNTLNQLERSNKVNPKIPNGKGYFRTLLEFYELTTIYVHFDYDIERPLRALIFFSKLLFIFCLTRPYDTEIPIVGIVFCMFGLKIVMNILERVMSKLGRVFDKFLFIFFAGAVIYILFNTFYLFIPTLDWVTLSQDWTWCLKYLLTFGIDLVIFQIGYFTIQYFVTKNITFSNNFTLPMKLLGYLFFKENISEFISS